MEAEQRYLQIKQGIEDACKKSGRKAEDITLIGVTKYVPIERIAPVIELGIKNVGENRAQELVEKKDFFSNHDLTIHFIGQLQTNKVKYVAGIADLVQSVDRWPLAHELQKHAANLEIVQNILVQVNIGNEIQKGGISADDVKPFLEKLQECPNLCVKGLMCVPPDAGEEGTRKYFSQMRELFEKLKSINCSNTTMEILSMGMSGDYKVAIEEGATMVRIGTALFGSRA